MFLRVTSQMYLLPKLAVTQYFQFICYKFSINIPAICFQNSASMSSTTYIDAHVLAES